MLIYIAAIVVCVLLILDCLQTLDIKNHAGFTEINLLLGEHPSDRKIVIYFLTWIVLLCVLVRFLPDMAMWLILGVVGAVEVNCLVSNYKLGLRLSSK
jgi:hypothetical protein